MAETLGTDVGSLIVEPQTTADTRAGASALAAPAPAAEALSPEAMQQDMTLEYDSMVFLSAIEQLTVRLQGDLTPGSLALALASLIELSNCVVQFVEQLPLARAREFSLEALMARDLHNYTQLGLQHVHAHRFSWEAFGRTMKTADLFYPISQDLLRILQTCLAIGVRAFHSSAMRQQWKTLYSGFLVNLAKILQKGAPNQGA